MIFLKTIYIIILITEVKSFLSPTDEDLLMVLMKSLRIRNCILASDSSLKSVNLLKLTTDQKIFTVSVKEKYLGSYLEDMDTHIYTPTAVVLKTNLSYSGYFDNKMVICIYLWLIFDAGDLKNELQKVYIPFNCGALLIQEVGDGHYEIYELYNIKKQSPIVIEKFGDWKNNNLLLVEKKWYDRKSDMRGYEFTTIKFNEELYLRPKDKVNEEIWKELSHMLNFKISEKTVPYSMDDEPLELAIEKEEEALLDTQIYIGVNKKFRHLLGPTSQSKLYMHLKVSGEDKGFTRFLKPFSGRVWMSIGLWVLFCGFFLCFVEFTSNKINKNFRRRNEMLFMILMPLNSVCYQSDSEWSKNTASQFVLFFIRIFGAVIYYAYAATFISYLLLYIPKLPFTDLKGLVEDGTYKIEAERNSDVDTFFRVSLNPLERLVYQKLMSDVKKWSRFDKGVDRMCAGEKLVLIGYDNDIDNYMPCNIVKIREPLKVFVNGFKIRFRSPFKGHLQIKILLLRTSGILQRVNNRILYANVKKLTKKEDYEIKLEKVFAAFILLAFGWILSLIILSAEIFFTKIKTQKKFFRKHF